MTTAPDYAVVTPTNPDIEAGIEMANALADKPLTASQENLLRTLLAGAPLTVA